MNWNKLKGVASEWNSEKQYDNGVMVLHDGVVYVSNGIVPIGTDIGNTKKWIVIDDNDNVNNLINNVSANFYAIRKYLWGTNTLTFSVESNDRTSVLIFGNSNIDTNDSDEYEGLIIGVITAYPANKIVRYKGFGNISVAISGYTVTVSLPRITYDTIGLISFDKITE